jgi:hypothetical protein
MFVHRVAEAAQQQCAMRGDLHPAIRAIGRQKAGLDLVEDRTQLVAQLHPALVRLRDGRADVLEAAGFDSLRRAFGERGPDRELARGAGFGLGAGLVGFFDARIGDKTDAVVPEPEAGRRCPPFSGSR